MIFVDTSGWYASVVPTDPQHQRVLGWLQSSADQLITTDYVIDEILTLLRVRGERNRAVDLGRRVFDLKLVTVHHISPGELQFAWETFRNNPARKWSFTDCTSRTVMERLHIRVALSFDQHFAEFGGLTLVP